MKLIKLLINIIVILLIVLFIWIYFSVLYLMGDPKGYIAIAYILFFIYSILALTDYFFGKRNK